MMYCVTKYCFISKKSADPNEMPPHAAFQLAESSLFAKVPAYQYPERK